jgi:hypothetical protein
MRMHKPTSVNIDTRIDSFLNRKFKQYPNLSTSEKAIGDLMPRHHDVPRA